MRCHLASLIQHQHNVQSGQLPPLIPLSNLTPLPPSPHSLSTASPLTSPPRPSLSPPPHPPTHPLTSQQVLSRPTNYDPTTLASLDTTCQTYYPDSFFATYNFKNTSMSTVSYSFSACRTVLNATYYYQNAPSSVTSLGGVCPHYRQKTYCPCVSTMATDTCSPVACYQPSNIATQVCSPFPASDIGYCYCQNKLSTLVTSGSIKLSDFQSLISSTAPGSCRQVCCSSLITHPINIPYKYTYPINTPSKQTINTSFQHILRLPSQHPINTHFQHTLSTHPINLPSRNTPTLHSTQ